jgi:hypothetical protein
MILKHAALFIGLIICLATVSGLAQPSNAVDSTVVASNAVDQAGAAPAPRPERVAQLGDPALPLHIVEWIKGRPVKVQPGTNIYVLVFCTLTRANEFALTNLSRLQEDYRDKGVVVVAISGESPEQLKQFVLLNGSQVGFTVAADELPGRTAQYYMHAFRQMQVPHAFVVGKDGNVLWHGHPLTDGMGEVVDRIASGRFDLEQEQNLVVAREQMDQYLMFARMNDSRSRRVGKMILTARGHDAPGLIDLAFKIATDNGIDDDKRDVELANYALDRAARLTNTNAADVAVTRSILLFQSGNQEAGLKRARETLASAQDPDEKKELEAAIRAMELRVAMEKTNHVAAATGTNQVAGPPGTNQMKSSMAKPN